MNRQHPLFSPLGCLGGLALIAGIAAAIFLTGGAIFSPGELTAVHRTGQPLKNYKSHADFENTCGNCHAPFAGVTAERCEACHADVGRERATSSGLHGKLKLAIVSQCQACHSDHHGPAFNPSLAAVQKFDHAILGFTLARHIVDYNSAPLACASCHTGANDAFQPATCIGCHGAHDSNFMLSHVSAFGQDCRVCHDGADRTHGFDHAKTKFSLIGAHVQLACTSCHKAAVAPADTPASCAGCHGEPAKHAGVFNGQDCTVCHTSTAWSPARIAGQLAFQHASAHFQLVNHTADYQGQPLTCTACHSGAAAGDFSVNTQACVSCHTGHAAAFMQAHVQQFGPNCISCHNGPGNMKNFDHARLFVLDGKHASLECTACHGAQNFQGASTACVTCHQEPAIHAGIFGTECQACHSTTAWAPARLTQHTFPLDHGGQGEIACQTCHVKAYTTYTCYGCHAHDPQEIQTTHAEKGISGDALLKCTACHASGRKPGDN